MRTTDVSSWVSRCVLAAVLLLGIYLRRVQISPNRVNPDHRSNSTMVVLFTMTWHSFPPPATLRQSSEWPQIAVGVHVVFFLSCIVGKTVHVLIICRASHRFMKLCCSTHQPFRALRPATVWFFWLIVRPPFLNRKVKHWFEDALVDDTVKSAPGFLTVLGQIELLAILYCVFVSFPTLLQSILIKLQFWSLLLNVQLITCLQVLRKYAVFIKINRLI